VFPVGIRGGPVRPGRGPRQGHGTVSHDLRSGNRVLTCAMTPANAGIGSRWNRIHGRAARGEVMASTRRVRIADVAARAGVGVGTVSRVLNGSPHVRESTRRRVLEAMDQTRYRPSRLAAALSRGAPASVAIVVPFLTRPSVVARLAGVIEVLDAEGYDTIVCNVETPAQRDRQVRMLAEGHRAAGAVVISLRLSAAQLAELADAGVRVVLVDAALRGVPHTVVDDVHGGMMATGHLLGLGHRRIAFIGDTPDGGLRFSSTSDRLRGYRRALAAAGITAEPALIRRGPHGSAAAAAMALRLFRLPRPPTAIFAASDTQAMGVLSAAEAAGLPVPAGLSVIGFDDIEMAAQLGLSTVRQPLRDSGARGAARLCALLRGGAVRPLREVLPLQLVPRRSTAAPAFPGPGAPRPDGPQSGSRMHAVRVS
jgi:DNA-binding LacI/PurR family transcriptional regulator